MGIIHQLKLIIHRVYYNLMHGQVLSAMINPDYVLRKSILLIKM